MRYFTNERDRRAILDHVRDARNRAECVLVSLHTHEGANENWYAPRAAPFIRARVSERGLPALATSEEAQAIARDMADLSVWYGTRYELRPDGLIDVIPGAPS